MPPNSTLPYLPSPEIERKLDFYPLLRLGVAFSAGFFFEFNVMTAAFGGPFLRLTDALLFLFIPCLFLSVGLANTVRLGLFYFVALFLLVAGTLLFKTAVQQGDMYLTLVLLATAVFAFYFAYLALRDEKFIIWFAIGTCLGLIPSIGVLLLQAAGGSKEALAAIGLGVPAEYLPTRTATLGTVKLGGLWAVGNEAGHIYAIGTASALYLALRFRRPFIYIIAYALLVTSFVFTLNRAGLFAPSAGLVYIYYRLGNYFLYVKTAILAICVGAVLLSYSNLSGLDSFTDTIETRFFTDDYAATNTAQRFDSTGAGIEIALENPFGIGYDERVDQVLHRTTDAEESVHNAFLSLSFQSGIFVTLLYMLSGIYLLVQRKTVQPFFIVMFLFTATSMMFEEINLNPFVLFSVTVTIAAAWLHYSTRARRPVPARAVPRPFKLANRQPT